MNSQMSEVLNFQCGKFYDEIPRSGLQSEGYSMVEWSFDFAELYVKKGTRHLNNAYNSHWKS